MSPSEPHLTTTTRSPASTALAALVPCADSGIRQTSRSGSCRGPVVGADGQQAGQFALRAGVRLQRDRVVAGDLGQRPLQAGDQLGVAAGLLGRGERVQRRELGPADRLHLGRRVELHRAGAERDHRPVQGDVGVGEPPQVAQQRGLAAVGVEHRVGQELVVAEQARRQLARPAATPAARRLGARSSRAAATSARVVSVVVSSQEIWIAPSPARYRLIPPARPGPRRRPRRPGLRAARPGSCRRTRPGRPRSPRRARVAASRAALRCACRAMAASPSGPW